MALLVACADEPTRPGAEDAENGGGGRAPARPVGLVEITISGLGSGRLTSSALSAPTAEALELRRREREAGAGGAWPGGIASQSFILPGHGSGGGDGTIQLELISTGSFTDGVRGDGGYRYLWATYAVRNAQDDGTPYDTPRRNLTFYAVDTESTIGTTAILSLQRFDGSAADTAIAAQLVPTGAVAKHPSSNAIQPLAVDVLQLLTEAEANAIQALADPTGVSDVFPYGFVVRNPNDGTSRTLPANPAENQFDGIVTFAFKVPLQANPADDPFTVSAIFLAVDDDEVRLTQSVEEQNAPGRSAFDARAAALGANVLTLLPPGGATVWTERELRVLCDVRIAGSSDNPTTTLLPAPDAQPWLVIDPRDPASQTLPRTVRLAAARCPGIASASPTTFSVHGFQSGRNVEGSYSGLGTPLVLAPTGRAGAFFPGEEVEVTLTTGLGGTKPVVARYRVAAGAGPGTFVRYDTDGLDLTPYAVAIGNINGDEHLDIVTANFGASNMSILTNWGGADMRFAISYNLMGPPSDVALGDLDGDGDPELVFSHGTRNHVTVMLNEAYGPQTVYDVGTRPQAVALGDVNGDGLLDIVTANSGSNSATVLLNQGGAQFSGRVDYATGRSPMTVALGDLDGDGDLDMVTANSLADSVTVVFNDGSGVFGTYANYAAGDSPSSVALGDLDGDGDIDLAVTNRNTNDVWVFFNQGGGAFGSPVAYPVGSDPRGIALGDLDGDGDLDMVVANYGSHTVSVFINQGRGTFRGAVGYAVGNAPQHVALGDMDGDGALDIVVVNSGNSGTYANSVMVLLNR